MQAGFVTHVGRRSSNQDNALLFPERGCYAVADGVGGGESGEEASALVCQQIKLSAQEGLPASQGILNAHESLREGLRAQHSRAYSASTAAVICLRESSAEVAWVGDSRVYLVRDEQLIQMTEDHVVSGQEHVLTQAIGAPLTGPLRVGTASCSLRAGDRWLICTDGLYNVVPEETLLDILCSRSSAQQLAEALLSEALRRGLDDNTTAIVLASKPDPVRIEGSTESPKNSTISVETTPLSKSLFRPLVGLLTALSAFALVALLFWIGG